MEKRIGTVFLMWDPQLIMKLLGRVIGNLLSVFHLIKTIRLELKELLTTYIRHSHYCLIRLHEEYMSKDETTCHQTPYHFGLIVENVMCTLDSRKFTSTRTFFARAAASRSGLKSHLHHSQITK